MSTLTEICACGGRFTASEKWPSDARKAADAWREGHRCSVVAVEPGPCWHASGYTGPGDTEFRCELQAGHAGAHECDRGAWGGSATWTDAEAEAVPAGDDGPCRACGQPYPTWRAADKLWNLVMGGPDATDDPGGMLCPTCFLRLADQRAPVLGAWVVGMPPPVAEVSRDD